MKRAYSHIARTNDARLIVGRRPVAFSLLQISQVAVMDSGSIARRCLGYRTPAQVFRKKLLAQFPYAG